MINIPIGAQIVHSGPFVQLESPSLVLVMPPQSGLLGGFATGLISIANYVRLNLPSVRVELLDLSAVAPSDLRAAILRAGLPLNRHTVVGLTSTTASYQSALKTAKVFKSLAIEGVQVTTVFGGHHVSADAETVLREHQSLVDYIIVGEGEVAMVDFLRNLPRVCATAGLAYLHHGHFHQNHSARLLSERELDGIGIGDRELKLLGTPGKFGHVTYVSARGCPLKCAFCSVANQKIRAKSVARVVQDIRELVKLGFSRIAIEDNFFAHTAERTTLLCKALAELRRDVEFTWDCQTRVESMDRPNLVPLMEAAGCEGVYLGVESLNADQLLYLRKVTNPERYLERLQRRVVPSILNSKLECYINLQFGLPHETFDHHAETRRCMRQLGEAALALGKEVTLFPMLHVVYPGTRHFHEGVGKGFFRSDIFEAFTAWEAQQAPVLRWLGKHFAHGTGGIPVGILDPEVLRVGRFESDLGRVVLPAAVFQIDDILNDLAELPGIRVFKYGTHLVNPDEADFSLAGI